MDITFEGCQSLDGVLKSERRAVRIKVADLSQFSSMGDNILIHKAQKDIWALNEDGTIERLYDNAEPLDI